MKKIFFSILVLSIAGTCASSAEMRLWTDKKGNSIEAEFVKILSDKVVLRTTKGRQLKVPQKGLCIEDQEYIKNAVPPQIEIKVDVSRDTDITGSSNSYIRKNEKIRCDIAITKKNREPSNRIFTAYVYVFAKDLGEKHLIVVDKETYEFTFGDEAKIEFSGVPSSLVHEKHEQERNNKGEKYEAYLVFILDSSDTLICAKSNRSEFEKKVDEIKKADIDSCFTVDLHLLKKKQEE